jgi:Fic family protein
MNELVEWTRQEIDKKQLHQLLIIAVFVVVFLEIHPFQDGNGRLSRALTTLLLMQSGYAYVPYNSLESVIEHNKEAYFWHCVRLRVPSGPTPPIGNPG